MAQAQVLMRASDPIFEMGLTMGGHRQEDRFWQHTLTALAAHFGHEAEVDTQVVCVDKKRQWSKWRNVWHSSAIRSTLYMLGAPGRGGQAPVHARPRGCLSAAARRSSSAPGPNGLAAAIALAQAGRAVTVLEGADTLGGGCRSEELTLPGLRARHLLDRARAGARLAVPAARCRWPSTGSSWCTPRRRWRTRSTTARAVVLERSVEETAARARPGRARLPAACSSRSCATPDDAVRASSSARCGRRAIRSRWPASGRARSARRRAWRARASSGERARALLAGCCAHSMLSLRTPASAAFGLVLALSAHAVGWPVARGGSQRLADALAVAPALARRRDRDRAPGRVARRAAGDAAPVLLDVTPRQLLRLAGDRLPDALRAAPRRATATGPGIFKLDWALDGPIPWRAPEVARAGTVHLGGTLERDRRPRRQAAAQRRAPRAAVRAARAADAASTRRARPRASTPPGPTATCRTAPRAT